MHATLVFLVTSFAASVAAAPVPISSVSPIENPQPMIVRDASEEANSPVLDTMKREILERLDAIIKRSALEDQTLDTDDEDDIDDSANDNPVFGANDKREPGRPAQFEGPNEKRDPRKYSSSASNEKRDPRKYSSSASNEKRGPRKYSSSASNEKRDPRKYSSSASNEKRGPRKYSSSASNEKRGPRKYSSSASNEKREPGKPLQFKQPSDGASETTDLP